MTSVSGIGPSSGWNALLAATRGAVPAPGANTAAGAADFQSLLLDSVRQTAGLESQAQLQIARGLETGDPSLAESVVAMREADLALRLMLQIQRKLVDTWNELRGMQL